MWNLRRNLGPRTSEQEREEVLAKTVLVVDEVYRPDQIYAFGSVLTSEFDSTSDVDILVVYSDISAASNAWRLHRKARERLPHALDVIAMDLESFDLKKEIGGIAFVAFLEGRRVK